MRLKLSSAPLSFQHMIYIEGLSLRCPGSWSRGPGLGLEPQKSWSCPGLGWSDLGLGQVGLDYNTDDSHFSFTLSLKYTGVNALSNPDGLTVLMQLLKIDSLSKDTK